MTSPEVAAELYEAFLQDLLLRLGSISVIRVLAFAPDSAGEYFRRLANDQFEVQPQTDGDLGDRMAAFFRDQFARGDRSVVLIGSDSPDLPLDRIEQAFRLLETRELVLGPCDDGGYYLIGLSQMIPELFSQIDWSTSSVYDQTLRRAAVSGIAPSVLDPWYDVDNLDDLRRLAGNLMVSTNPALPLQLPHTAVVLDSIHHLL